jgi:hypothetical protein
MHEVLIYIQYTNTWKLKHKKNADNKNVDKRSKNSKHKKNKNI